MFIVIIYFLFIVFSLISSHLPLVICLFLLLTQHSSLLSDSCLSFLKLLVFFYLMHLLILFEIKHINRLIFCIVITKTVHYIHYYTVLVYTFLSPHFLLTCQIPPLVFQLISSINRYFFHTSFRFFPFFSHTISSFMHHFLSCFSGFLSFFLLPVLSLSFPP